MSANPLQGIQVINSVNPCSSTPLHRPIYPYHYRGFPILPRPRRPYSPPALPSLARSSSLHLPHPLTWNLDSPLPGSTHPPPLRLQEKVENCDYKDFPGVPPVATPPFPSYVLSSPFYRSSLLLPSSRPLLTARNLLAAFVFCPLFCPPLPAALFRSFLYFLFFPTLSRFFPQIGRAHV